MKIRHLFAAAGAALLQTALPGCAFLQPKKLADFDVATQMIASLYVVNQMAADDLPETPPDVIGPRSMASAVAALKTQKANCAFVGGEVRKADGRVQSGVIVVRRSRDNNYAPLRDNDEKRSVAATTSAEIFKAVFGDPPGQSLILGHPGSMVHVHALDFSQCMQLKKAPLYEARSSGLTRPVASANIARPFQPQARG